MTQAELLASTGKRSGKINIRMYLEKILEGEQVFPELREVLKKTENIQTYIKDLEDRRTVILTDKGKSSGGVDFKTLIGKINAEIALAKLFLQSEEEVSIPDVRKRLTKIKNSIPKSMNLRSVIENDLRELKEIEVKESKKWTVVDTDDPNDILLCGTIGGSCQNVDYDPELNRGLLGYLLDGKNRLIAVKDSRGELVGRCLLRLLLNKDNEPVLYAEPHYTKHEDKKIDELLDAMCLQRAKDLGLDLFGEGDTPVIIRSLGSKLAPCEYVDSTGDIEKRCEFVIERATMIYQAV